MKVQECNQNTLEAKVHGELYYLTKAHTWGGGRGRRGEANIANTAKTTHNGVANLLTAADVMAHIQYCHCLYKRKSAGASSTFCNTYCL